MPGLVLLDVDGVINARVRPGDRGRPEVAVPEGMPLLVRRLASVATVHWATTWTPEVVSEISRAVGLPMATPAVPMLRSTPGAQTPKLASTRRWLERQSAAGQPWDRAVWIDDHLGPDARAWAEGNPLPTLLVHVDRAIGLTADEVAQVVRFLTEGDGTQ